VAAAAGTRISHIVARVMVAPPAAPEYLLCQVRDSMPSVQTEAPAVTPSALVTPQDMQLV